MLEVKIVIDGDPTPGLLMNIQFQTYKHVHIVYGSDWNKAFLDEPRYDICGFIKNTDRFYGFDCLSKIVKTFEQDLKLVGLVYFDKYLLKNGKLIEQLYPPFESGSNHIYCPPIFVNCGIKVPLFDPNLDKLKTFDAIRKISTGCRIIHIPELLLQSDFEITNIDKELEYVGKNR